jgi:hypothetical protein
MCRTLTPADVAKIRGITEEQAKALMKAGANGDPLGIQSDLDVGCDGGYRTSLDDIEKYKQRNGLS